MKDKKFSNRSYSQDNFKRIKRKKVLFTLSIVVLIACMPLLYTSLTDENVLIPTYVAYIIIGIMAIFTYILIKTAGKNYKTTFEGEIFKKEVEKVKNKSGSVTYNSRLYLKDVNGYNVFFDLYVDRKQKKADKRPAFKYYKPGDKIKKIYGLKFPEKLDKSKDDEIICVKCGRLNDKDNDKCKKCKFPIYK